MRRSVSLSLSLLVSLWAMPLAAQDAPPAAAEAPAAEAPAEDTAAPTPEPSPLQQADTLFDQGTLKSIQASLPLYSQVADAEPKNFEAQWKAGRAHRQYADKAKERQKKNWKKLSAKHGKLGMKYSARAIELEPSKPHGHHWYGSSVGTYADGVSIITALSEGLKDKTEKAFEKAYSLDKKYNEAGPVLALGRFWSVLPWPMTDNDKALKYLREFQKYYPNKAEGQIYLAEVLIDEGGDAFKAEAGKLLDKAEKSGVPYYVQRAKELRKDL